MTRQTQGVLVALALLAAPAGGWAEDGADDGARIAQDELLRESAEILEELARLRGIAATEPVTQVVLDRESVLERVREIVDREVPESARRSADALADAFGLMSDGETWFERYLELLTAEVAGFYDHNAKALYVLRDTPLTYQRPVLAHELFHAVQDQRWGLSDVIGHAQWLTDPALAMQALIEGDAVVAMTAHTMGDASALTKEGLLRQTMLQALSGSTAINTSGAPAVMWAQLVFPYAAGLEFVFSIVEPNDWSPVDRAYEAPPLSTEQVLHPERYLDRDAPTWLTHTLDPPGAYRAGGDVFGEMMMASICRQLLADFISAGACDRAADGWDGDRADVFHFEDDEGRSLLVWVSVWDSIDEAGAFSRVLSRLADAWLGVTAVELPGTAHGGAWEAMGPDGRLWIERWGDLVLVASDRGGTASARARRDTLRDVVTQLWSTLQRSEYPAF